MVALLPGIWRFHWNLERGGDQKGPGADDEMVGGSMPYNENSSTAVQGQSAPFQGQSAPFRAMVPLFIT